MAKTKERTNPFYVLLVIVGVIFSITACAYGLMALKAFSPVAQHNSESGERLLMFLDRWGLWLLVGELAVLALATFAAMFTDQYWSANPPEKSDSSHEHFDSR